MTGCPPWTENELDDSMSTRPIHLTTPVRCPALRLFWVKNTLKRGHQTVFRLTPRALKGNFKQALTAGILLSGLMLAVMNLSCSRTSVPTTTSGPPAIITNNSGLAMVAIPGGSFEMGSAAGESDETLHRVALSPFYMDQHEVTQESFQKIMGRNPSRWTEPKNPVEQIRWKDAAEYCNARSHLEGLTSCYDPQTWKCDFKNSGYRLPTEAEWEYACRAGTRTKYFFGDDPAELGKYASFKGNSTRSPSAVGSKRPNPWGLYDMYGSVWEWCNDFYKEDYYRKSPERDPSGPDTSQTRVVRGGCWNSRSNTCRSGYRLDENPAYTDVCFGRDVHGFVGFRCVRKQDTTL
jgi:sulfatase modifying factor 1